MTEIAAPAHYTECSEGRDMAAVSPAVSRPTHASADLMDARILQARNAGVSWGKLAAEFGITREQVRNRWNRLINGHVNMTRAWTDDERAEVERCARLRMTNEEIAERVGHPVASVANAITKLRKVGAEIPDRRSNGGGPVQQSDEEQVSVARQCLSCEEKFEAPSRFLRLCDTCRVEVRSVAWSA